MLGISWINVAGGAIAAFLLSWGAHTLDVHRIEANWQKKLDDQKTTLIQQCADDKKLTEDSNGAYRNKVAALNRKLADAKRMQSVACVIPTITQPAGSINGEAVGNQHAGPHAVAAESLIDFAGDCEKYRLQIISMQDFEDQVWKGR